MFISRRICRIRVNPRSDLHTHTHTHTHIVCFTFRVYMNQSAASAALHICRSSTHPARLINPVQRVDACWYSKGARDGSIWTPRGNSYVPQRRSFAEHCICWKSSRLLQQRVGRCYWQTDAQTASDAASINQSSNRRNFYSAPYITWTAALDNVNI